MSDIDRIKDKLAKLLRLGEDTAATDGEIQNALNLATQMMAKHQLTREDIDTSAPDPIARVTLGRHFAFAKSTKATTWESQLSSFVKHFIGSVSIYTTVATVRRNGLVEMAGDDPRRAAAFVFYGSDDDARCAAAMFEELRDAIATMAIIRWGGWARGDGNAYAFGFVTGLLEAHRDSKRALMNSDATTHALILKSDETSLAIIDKGRQWLATTHNVRLGKPKSSSRTITFRGSNARSAISEGRRDGANYDPTRPTASSRRHIA